MKTKIIIRFKAQKIGERDYKTEVLAMDDDYIYYNDKKGCYSRVRRNEESSSYYMTSFSGGE